MEFVIIIKILPNLFCCTTKSIRGYKAEITFYLTGLEKLYSIRFLYIKLFKLFFVILPSRFWKTKLYQLKKLDILIKKT